MPTIYTNTQVISQINSGAKWSGSQFTYGFLQSSPSWDIGYEGDGFTAFTAYQATATRRIVSLWDDLIAPSFLELTSSQQNAKVNFGNTTSSIDYAHAYYPGNYAWAGEVWLNAQTYPDLYAPDPGDYNWMTILHELGHAIGLSHPGTYNGGSPTYANDAVYAQDTHQWTVMSYFSASNTGADWNGGNGWQYAQTPMVHDVLTIQAIYSADQTTRVGNTIYGFNSNTGNWVFDFAQNQSPVLTVYDAGGTDTLDLSGFSQRAIVNLAPGTYSSVGGTTSSMTNNIGIANNTWIENATGGAGNDTFYGNELANQLAGNAGNDHLFGYDGSDILSGGSGIDWAHFTLGIASYTFQVSQSTIQVIDDFVDIVFDDVEWFSFNDTELTYEDLVSQWGTQTAIEANGSTSLTKAGNHFFLKNSDASGPSLKYSGADVVTGQFGSWAPIAAEQTATGYSVVWKMTGTDQYTVWSVNSSGNYISHIAPVSGADYAVQSLETSFHQDLNGDAQLGLLTTVIEANGSTSLTKVGSNYAIGGSGPSLKYSGADVVTGQFGSWAPIAAEQTATGYSVVWKMTGTDQYTVWSVNSSGNYISHIAPVSGADYAVQSLETSFHQDLNGDAQLGLLTTIIEANGSTSLTKVGSNYAIGGSGPSLKYSGADVVTGQFGSWAPIAAEQTATGYSVVWKMTGTDQYTVWSVNSSGNYISHIAPVSGADYAVQSLETSFHQDLNGDAQLGLLTTVIEANGSTSLTKVGSNYAIGGSGPSLKYSGADVVTGQFGSWAPIAAEQTATGYSVVWKMTGTDQYTVWSVNSSGNYISHIAPVSGADYAVQSLETSFHQDLNGDAQLGLLTTVIEANGSTSLTKVGSNYAIGGSGPSLKYSGADVVTGQFGSWAPIAAEQTATGYSVVWKMTGTDQYTVWSVNSSGNYVSHIAPVSGVDYAVQSLETSFHQDLNGDAQLGLLTTTGSNQNTVWNIGGSDNYTGSVVGGVSEVDATLQAPEPDDVIAGASNSDTFAFVSLPGSDNVVNFQPAHDLAEFARAANLLAGLSVDGVGVINVNDQSTVIEEILEYGRPHHINDLLLV